MSPEISLPEPEEMELAKHIGKELSLLEQRGKNHGINLVFRKGSQELELPFPIIAFQLLMRVIEQVALGNSVTIIPVHAQLTTQEAADLLNVSRTFVVKLLKDGKIPFVKVGSHRRIKYGDLVEYKKKMTAESEKARDQLAELGQEIEMDE